jgi:hypothetical protein
LNEYGILNQGDGGWSIDGEERVLLTLYGKEVKALWNASKNLKKCSTSIIPSSERLSLPLCSQFQIGPAHNPLTPNTKETT